MRASPLHRCEQSGMRASRPPCEIYSSLTALECRTWIKHNVIVCTTTSPGCSLACPSRPPAGSLVVCVLSLCCVAARVCCSLCVVCSCSPSFLSCGVACSCASAVAAEAERRQQQWTQRTQRRHTAHTHNKASGHESAAHDSSDKHEDATTTATTVGAQRGRGQTGAGARALATQRPLLLFVACDRSHRTCFSRPSHSPLALAFRLFLPPPLVGLCGHSAGSTAGPDEPAASTHERETKDKAKQRRSRCGCSRR